MYELTLHVKRYRFYVIIQAVTKIDRAEDSGVVLCFMSFFMVMFIEKFTILKYIAPLWSYKLLFWKNAKSYKIQEYFFDQTKNAPYLATLQCAVHYRKQNVMSFILSNNRPVAQKESFSAPMLIGNFHGLISSLKMHWLKNVGQFYSNTL